MDDGTPALAVGFAIDTGGSFDELIRLQSVMESTEGKIVADAARIEKATAGMVSFSGATVQMTSFSNAATKEMRAAAREIAQAEKAGESLSRQLGRQASTFGKTKEELRAMKVETSALAAEQQGLTELAQRLRAQEAALYDMEFAAMRRVRQEAEALAEDRATAAAQAVAAANRESQAIRAAAFAHQMFEVRVRQGATALREEEASVERDAIALARLRAMLDARTFVEGQPVSTKFLEFRNSQESANEAAAAQVALIGAATPDGTAFVLDVDRVKVTADKSLAQKFDETGAANELTDARVTLLREAIVSPAGGAQARAMLKAEAGGRLAGIVLIAEDGTTTELSEINLVAGVTRIMKEDGTVLSTFGYEGDKVYIPNLNPSSVLFIETGVILDPVTGNPTGVRLFNGNAYNIEVEVDTRGH